MSKLFSKLASVFLGLISVLQLIRFVMGWVVTINEVVVPVWASAIAFVVLGGLALMVWRETRS